MPNPKRQHSRQRGRKRRTHQKLIVNMSDTLAQGSQMGFNHRVDPITGYYKGKQVINVGPRVKKEKKAAVNA